MAKFLTAVLGVLLIAAFVGLQAFVLWQIMVWWGRPSPELAFLLVAGLWLALVTVRSVFLGGARSS